MPVLKGFVRDVRYIPHLNTQSGQPYPLAEFDINTVRQHGLVNLGTPENNLAYARWISPKRTRSYPFARLYDIFHYNTRKVAIIPIIKDEGAASGNNDRINYMTFSWMSLLDIFIVLAWYDDAKRKPGEKELITAQKLNAAHIREKLTEISQYHLSALHWNTSHFERDFEPVYRTAVESYRQISDRHNVRLHRADEHLKVLERYRAEGKFDLQLFKRDTLNRSMAAAQRELRTSHLNESLSDGEKHLLYVSNYLGGEYHLAPDEVYNNEGIFIIQEAKNSTKTSRLPSQDDIKDGLFKLILYSNLHELSVDGIITPFISRLKLTGSFRGKLALPQATPEAIAQFCILNRLTRRQIAIIEGLSLEANSNQRLNILLVGRDDNETAH